MRRLATTLAAILAASALYPPSATAAPDEQDARASAWAQGLLTAYLSGGELQSSLVCPIAGTAGEPRLRRNLADFKFQNAKVFDVLNVRRDQIKDGPSVVEVLVMLRANNYHQQASLDVEERNGLFCLRDAITEEHVKAIQKTYAKP